MTKSITLTALSLAMLSLVLTGCGAQKSTTAPVASAPETTTNEAVTPAEPEKLADGKYQVDTTASQVSWTGKMALVQKEHSGTIAIKAGSLELMNGQLSQGSVNIDMTTIKTTDLQGDSATKLNQHLSGADFFDVAKYPESKLVIKRVEAGNDNNYTITADLTIKDKTNEISFPASVASDNGKLMASAEFNIDRSKWEIKYGSDKFFDNLGDKAIDNNIAYKITLVAAQ